MSKHDEKVHWDIWHSWTMLKVLMSLRRPRWLWFHRFQYREYLKSVLIADIDGVREDLKQAIRLGLQKQGRLLIPRSSLRSEQFSRSHDHVQTVKNRSSWSSKASWPRVSRIDLKVPWESWKSAFKIESEIAQHCDIPWIAHIRALSELVMPHHVWYIHDTHRFEPERRLCLL